MRQFVLDLNFLEPYEAGAQLLALICYPAESDEKACASLSESLCVKAIQADADGDVEWKDESAPIKRRYLLANPDVVGRDWKRCQKIMRQRLGAAHMVMPFLVEVETGSTPKINGVKRLSIRAMASVVLAYVGQTEPTNVVKRIWRPALPMLHVVAAVATYMSKLERAGVQRVDYGHIMFDLNALREIVRDSVKYAGYIGKSRRLRIDPQKLVRITLREKRGQKKRRS